MADANTLDTLENSASSTKPLAVPGRPHIKEQGVPQVKTKLLSEESVAEIQKKMVRYPVRKSAVLPALTVAYRQLGFLTDEVYAELEMVTEIPRLQIAEAATFYTLFPKKPRGKHLIMVCDNISCALCGADSLVKYLQEKLEIKMGETTEDGLFTLQISECLAGCSAAPMMMVNHTYHENLTRAKIDSLIDKWRTEG